ncbi:uncharacterized protein METZ01_LOCUS332336 [marine metagenome]|uniref:Bacterial repeat domain-containing protein n=1 Tax=marine metagenome TaxID=408172 RepID=A0A382Q4U7_9ZZZZ
MQIASASGGSALGGGHYIHGTNAVITAIPDSGYYFTGWGGNGVIDANSTLTVTR